MKRYVAAAVEQGLWSILNLGVNLALARMLAPAEFGGFVFWANMGLVLSSLQNALTVCHLQALAPGPGSAPHRIATETLMHRVNAVFLALVALCALGACAVMKPGPLASPAVALYLPAYLLQQYVRSLSFSRGRPVAAAIQTGAVLVLALGAVGFVLATKSAPSTNDILLAMALAYGVVGVTTMVRAMADQLHARVDYSLYADYARQSGWVFLGVTTTELLARFYSFVVAGWYGPSALAVLAATQLFLRPAPLLASVWSVVARADLTRHRDADDMAAYGRTTVKALLFGLPLTLVWAVVLALAWPLVSHWAFAGKYAGFAWLVVLWGVSAAFSYGQAVVSTALQARRAFKPLALANTTASLAAAVAIVVITRFWGYGGAVAGTALGQGLELMIMAFLLMSIVRRTVTVRLTEGT